MVCAWTSRFGTPGRVTRTLTFALLVSLTLVASTVSLAFPVPHPNTNGASDIPAMILRILRMAVSPVVLLRQRRSSLRLAPTGRTSLEVGEYAAAATTARAAGQAWARPKEMRN